MDDSMYVVADGDTIVGVSIKTGISENTLRKLNHLNSTTPLLPGQFLMLRRPPVVPLPQGSTITPPPIVDAASLPGMVPGESTLNLDTSRIVGLGNPHVAAAPATGIFSRLKNTFWGGVKTPTPPPLSDPVYPSHSPDTLLSSIDTDAPNNVVLLHAADNLEQSVIQEYHVVSSNGGEVITQSDEALDAEIVSVKHADGSSNIENRDVDNMTSSTVQDIPPVIAPIPTRMRQDSGGYPHIQGSSQLLNAAQLAQLYEKIPIVLQFDTWIKLYSVLDNGADLSTFYNSTAYSPYSIIVVQTYDNEVFGGFASDVWKPSTKFYGSGESFVFKVVDGNVEVYPWSGLNSFFMWSSEEKIAMGGGGDGFAFVLDSDFYTGDSSCSETFNNPLLVSTNKSFRVIDVEVWGFQDLLNRYKKPTRGGKNVKSNNYWRESSKNMPTSA